MIKIQKNVLGIMLVLVIATILVVVSSENPYSCKSVMIYALQGILVIGTSFVMCSLEKMLSSSTEPEDVTGGWSNPFKKKKPETAKNISDPTDVMTTNQFIGNTVPIQHTPHPPSDEQPRNTSNGRPTKQFRDSDDNVWTGGWNPFADKPDPNNQEEGYPHNNTQEGRAGPEPKPKPVVEEPEPEIRNQSSEPEKFPVEGKSKPRITSMKVWTPEKEVDDTSEDWTEQDPPMPSGQTLNKEEDIDAYVDLSDNTGISPTYKKGGFSLYGGASNDDYF
jgi:hypothetical protein